MFAAASAALIHHCLASRVEPAALPPEQRRRKKGRCQNARRRLWFPFGTRVPGHKGRISLSGKGGNLFRGHVWFVCIRGSIRFLLRARSSSRTASRTTSLISVSSCKRSATLRLTLPRDRCPCMASPAGRPVSREMAWSTSSTAYILNCPAPVAATTSWRSIRCLMLQRDQHALFPGQPACLADIEEPFDLSLTPPIACDWPSCSPSR